MKTDHIFYRIFKQLPQTLFQLIGEAEINLSNYRFESVEVKETSSIIDGVLLPNNSELPVYFTEVQFQKKLDIYARLFSETFTYLKHNDPCSAWGAFVLFKNRNIEPSPKDRKYYEPLLQSSQVRRIYLSDLKLEDSPFLGIKIIRLIVASKKQVFTQVPEVIKQVKEEKPDLTQQLDLLNLVETIVLAKLPKLSRKELESMFGVEDLKRTTFAQEMRLEGKLEGKLETKLETVQPLLAEGLSIQKIAKILGLEVAQIQAFINNR